MWAGLAYVVPFGPGPSPSPLYPGSAQHGCCGEPSPGASRTCKYVSSLGFPLSSRPTSLCVRHIFFFPFGCTHGTWDLSFPVWDGIRAPCSGGTGS